jgi:AcrR family transcriptional regulator
MTMPRTRESEAATSVARRLPAAERRAKILSVATKLIARSGYNGVSLDSIAVACGISRAGVLHYFSSKEQLLVAVLEERDRRSAALLVAADGPVGDARAARALIEGVINPGRAERQLVRLNTVLSAEALDPQHPAHEYFANRAETATSYLAVNVFAWHRDPESAATMLLAFLDGLQLAWLRNPKLDFMMLWSRFADSLFGAVENLPNAPNTAKARADSTRRRS